MLALRVAAVLLPLLVLQLASADLCEDGKKQSPIRIDSLAVKRRCYKRKFSWKESNSRLVIKNNGASVQVEYTGCKPAIRFGPLNNIYYHELSTFIWGVGDTDGGNHAINGDYKAAEYEAVYINEKYNNPDEAMKHDDGFAIIAIHFKLCDKDNKELDDLFDGVASVTTDPGGVAQSLAKDALDFAFKRYSCTKYYTYKGSLPVEPCTENTRWLVMQRQIPISSAQLAKFREVLDSDGDPILANWRFSQELNGRTVYSPNCGSK